MCKDLNQPIAKHDLINLETMLAEGKLNLNYNIPTYVTYFFFEKGKCKKKTIFRSTFDAIMVITIIKQLPAIALTDGYLKIMIKTNSSRV